MSRLQPGRLVRLSLTIALPVIAIVGFMQRDAIYDWWRLYDYTPPTAIASLASAASMTDEARNLFYVNHPVLQTKAGFSKKCPVDTEQSVVLGCYKSAQRGIYLLDIDNAELAGIEQVTAAHEMLHAAYDRLDAKERQRVDDLLLSYYNTELKDEAVKKTVDSYKKTEPDDVVNEMHSIFGTQVSELPAELSSYYERYFTNRQAVVGYYRDYEAAFSKRQQQIGSYDRTLQSLKPQITQLEATTNQQQADLRQRRSAIEQLNAGTNPQAYNRSVDAYNAAVETFNANVRRLQALIAEHNDIVNKRNAIALEERQLARSLTAPAQTQ